LDLLAFGQDQVSGEGAKPGEKVCAGPVLSETPVGFEEGDVRDFVRLDTRWTKPREPQPQPSMVGNDHALVILHAACPDSEDCLIDFGIVHGAPN
jgi:hypothetical protein